MQSSKFNSHVRESGESVVSYIAALKSLAKFCNYDMKLDEMVRDRIVCGINNARIQSRLLQERDLNYQIIGHSSGYGISCKDIADMQKKNSFNRGTSLTSSSDNSV